MGVYPKYKSFQKSVATLRALQRSTYRRRSPFRLHIMRVKHRIAVYKWWKAHPNSGVKSGIKFDEGKYKRENREFFMNNDKEILSSTGADLDILAEAFDVDKNLPTKEKQEQVYDAMAQQYIYGDKEWNKKEIARQKKHFLETIEKTHFINLTCSILQIKESLVRTWIRTDPEFALAVRSAQVRFGERVGHAVLVKAINGDMAAAMYVLKEFKEAVKFVDPQVEEIQASDTSMVDNLTPEEQETLLHLTRKAKQKAIDNGEDVSNVQIDYTGQNLIGAPSIESAEEKFANLDEEEAPQVEFVDSEQIIEEYENGD